MRIDKWLWAARFFKTRSLASQACELGRVQYNGQRSKPSREIRLGDLLRIKTPSGDFEVEVVQLSEMRGPATIAQTIYRETDASRERRLLAAEEQRSAPYFDDQREGKPSKRDRRRLDLFRGRT